ncbi:MAG: hypothetical protein OXG49_10070 [Chloroflexi bacterium]|nr:hypothetical protein [Chloroflexota bacterium]
MKFIERLFDWFFELTSPGWRETWDNFERWLEAERQSETRYEEYINAAPLECQERLGRRHK